MLRTAPNPGARVARAARYDMRWQVEAGHEGPITMRFGTAVGSDGICKRRPGFFRESPINGSRLARFRTAAMADGFCASRLSGTAAGWFYGESPRSVDCAAIIEGATPVV